MEVFHCWGYQLRSKVVQKICPRWGTNALVFVVNTTLQIPLGPGALKGESLLMTLSTWSSVIFVKWHTGSGYVVSSRVRSGSWGGLKNASYRRALFS